MSKITVILLSFALLAGCSAKHARIQDVSITTDPTGIRAMIGDQSCITPCTLANVDRTSEYVLFEQGAFRQRYALDKKFSRPMTTVEFIGLKIGIPAVIITGAAYEIHPIHVKFSGPAENPLITASSLGDMSGLHEVEVEPDLKKEQISSTEPVKRPFALSVGASYNYYPYGARTLTGLLMFEKGISTRWLSWYLAVGYADYGSTQDDYRDTAHGMGGEVGMNLYLRGRTLEGPYVGGGLGSWRFKGGWKDDAGTPFETTGRGTASVVDLNVHLGYKWYPAGYRDFFIDPSIALDLMSSDNEPYAFGPAAGSVKAGLAIGKRW